MSYNWKWFRAGRMSQVSLTCGADVAALAELDRKQWIAISMPTTGVRFDLRMLELMDTDHDGRIRTPEVLAAIDFLKSKNVDFDSLFSSGEAEEKALADVTAKQADLAKLDPSAADKKALAEWEAKGQSPEVAVVGDGTADASAALAAVEPVVDAFFLPPEDMPLVTEEAALGCRPPGPAAWTENVGLSPEGASISEGHLLATWRPPMCILGRSPAAIRRVDL